MRLVWLLLLASLMAGCARSPAPPPELEPTAVPLEAVDDAPATALAETPTRPAVAEASNGPEPSIARAPTSELTLTATPTLPPPAVGTGVSPEQALQVRPPEQGFEAPVDWRPPPVSVPHALHPDDHFFLARPLAPDARTYDLEWYPYGNRPLRPDAQPYRIHHGMDFPNDTGTPVFAAASGTVVHAGPLVSPRDGVNYYGNTVVIRHDWQWQNQDVYTLYAHTLELFVEEGDRVAQGQLIAGVGASGEVSGPHLHLEVRLGENHYANTRNPALWLAPYEGWGVLAGRFIDSRGRFIHGALITLIPENIEAGFEMNVRRQRTYTASGVNPDDAWDENFVVADLPAGEYTLVLSTSGEVFRRTIQLRPGQTNFVVVQADFEWLPTPTPTPTLAPSPVITTTLTLTPTPTAEP